MSEQYTDALGIRWSSKTEHDEWKRQAAANLPGAQREIAASMRRAFGPYIVPRDKREARKSS